MNHVTVSVPDLDEGWRFYTTLGLTPVVDARPNYARFACPYGGGTFSLHPGQGSAATTVYFECDDLAARVAALEAAGLHFTNPPTDQPWRWREAELFDPGDNRILLYFAGENRLDPPWKVGA